MGNDGFLPFLKLWLVFFLAFFLMRYPVLLALGFGLAAGLAGGTIAAALAARKMPPASATAAKPGDGKGDRFSLRKRLEERALGVSSWWSFGGKRKTRSFKSKR